MQAGRGRPNRLQSLWRLIGNLVRGNQQAELIGSQDPLAEVMFGAVQRRRYPLEIPEYPVRDPDLARQLIDLCHNSYDGSHTLLIAQRDTFSSADGDDQGWSVAETLADNTPVHPDVLAILRDLISRQKGKEKILGGGRLKKALWNALGYGDCFMEFAIDRDGLGRSSDMGISETLYLPTWEMFVVEDQQGRVIGYAQSQRLVYREDLMNPTTRQRLIESGIIRWFEAVKVVHFKHQEQTLYGRSIFPKESRDAWYELQQLQNDKKRGLRALGVNPNLHIMPQGKDLKFLNSYRLKYQQMLQEGTITDMFMLNGGDIRKPMGVNNNFEGFFKEETKLRQKIVPPGVPVWMYPGLGVEQKGTREIAREPSRAYARMRYDWCTLLTEGIKYMCDVEIILRKGFDWFLENGQYRIVWTKFTEHMTLEELQVAQAEETNEDGVDDLDEDGDTPAPASGNSDDSSNTNRFVQNGLSLRPHIFN